jgi:glutamyl-tRNA synthetase
LSTVRVRFAPSPTGYLHVGGLRTALYNFLFARKQGGVFVLRIEDTDRSRYVEGAVKGLIETLRWAGLDYDEGPGKDTPLGPYVQSERLSIYKKHVDRLLEGGKAYWAFDTPEELEEMRKMRLPQRYGRRALTLSPAEVRRKLEDGVPAVVRLKVPDATTVALDDVVRGHVEFASDEIDDQVLLKSDGYPTYHLANVVDDHLMGVTHVIRGEEWLSSTPKHVLLYQYFGWDLPIFAHLPLLLNPDRSKLSKRQGDVAVEEYRKKGYLPEALVNFVSLLGWNPGHEGEIFTMQELIEQFSLDRVGKSGAVFNLEKLKWMNAQHVRRLPDEVVLPVLRRQLHEAGFEGFDDGYLGNVIALLKERVDRIEQYFSAGRYFFEIPEGYDEEARKKSWRPESKTHLADVLTGLRAIDVFDHQEIERVVRSVAEKHSVGAGKVIHALRLAVTGLSTGPGLFELMEVIGRDGCTVRIEHALLALG